MSTDDLFEDPRLSRHSEVEPKVHEEEHNGGDGKDTPAVNGVIPSGLADGHCAVVSTNGKRFVPNSGRVGYHGSNVRRVRVSVWCILRP